MLIEGHPTKNKLILNSSNVYFMYSKYTNINVLYLSLYYYNTTWDYTGPIFGVKRYIFKYTLSPILVKFKYT